MGTKGRKNKKSFSGKIKNRKTKLQPEAGKKVHPEIAKDKKKQREIKSMPRARVTGWRLWAFRLIAITIVPVLLFLLLEVTLRITGYGFPSDIVIKTKVNDQDYYCSNARFSWRFFPPQIARTSYSFAFPVKKSENTYRIFVMGASAAAGTPDSAFCFGRILQVMLEQQYPQTNFEVITTAMAAINSHVVLEIAKDCSKREADLFIIYLGNNEVVGPYGAGTVFTPLSSNISLIRFGIKIKATKIGQLLSNLLALTGRKDTPGVWRGLEMFLEKQVRADDANLEIVYRHFQRNLKDMCQIALKKKIPVILSTVASNLKDHPPFASLHRRDLTDEEEKSWDNFYQEGIKYETDGDYAEAVVRYLKADEIDSTFADLQFRLGRCFWALGEYEKGKQKYIQAREMDTLRFRADSRINDIIRDIASDKTADGVYCVDAMNIFEVKSPQGITGEELFYEHVHMNFSGNYLLAQSVYQQVQNIIPEFIKRNKANASEIPSEAECARYLAYTDWEKYRIANTLLKDFIERPPFTNQLYHDKQVGELEKTIQDARDSFTADVLARIESQYNWAVQENSSDWLLFWKYGEFLEEQNKYGEAIRMFRSVLNFVPQNFEAFAKVGFLLGNLGDFSGAVENNQEALRLYPFSSITHYNLGLAYQFQNDREKAVEHYSRSIQLKPDYAQAYNNLGGVLYQLKRTDQAIEIYHRGLEQVPDDRDMNYNLGLIFRLEGRRSEAVEMFKKALEIDPKYEKAIQALQAIEK